MGLDITAEIQKRASIVAGVERVAARVAACFKVWASEETENLRRARLIVTDDDGARYVIQIQRIHDPPTPEEAEARRKRLIAAGLTDGR